MDDNIGTKNNIPSITDLNIVTNKIILFSDILIFHNMKLMILSQALYLIYFIPDNMFPICLLHWSYKTDLSTNILFIHPPINT